MAYRKLAFLNTFFNVKSRFEYGRFLLPAMTRDMRYKVQDKGAEGLRELSWTFHRPCGCCGGLVRERIMLIQTSGRLRIVGTFRRCVCVAGAECRVHWDDVTGHGMTGWDGLGEGELV